MRPLRSSAARKRTWNSSSAAVTAGDSFKTASASAGFAALDCASWTAKPLDATTKDSVTASDAVRHEADWERMAREPSTAHRVDALSRAFRRSGRRFAQSAEQQLV